MPPILVGIIICNSTSVPAAFDIITGDFRSASHGLHASKPVRLCYEGRLLVRLTSWANANTLDPTSGIGSKCFLIELSPRSHPAASSRRKTYFPVQCCLAVGLLPRYYRTSGRHYFGMAPGLGKHIHWRLDSGLAIRPGVEVTPSRRSPCGGFRQHYRGLVDVPHWARVSMGGRIQWDVKSAGCHCCTRTKLLMQGYQRVLHREGGRG